MKQNLPKSKNQKTTASEKVEANVEIENTGGTKPKNKTKKLFIKVLRKIVNFELPKIKLPKITIPKIKLPKLTLPKIKLPKLTLPKIKLPKLSLPKIKLPKLALPKGKKKDKVVASDNSNDTNQENESENKKENKKGSKKDNKKLIIIGAAVALVVAGAAYIFVIKPKQEAKNPENEVVEEVKPTEPEEPIVYPHANVVYNTDLWYDDANWQYDNSYYDEFNQACTDLECTLMVTENLNGAMLSFTVSKDGLFESCGDYLCTTTNKLDSFLSYIEITYPDGTVGERYSAGEYKLKTTGVWDLISNALYSDMKNDVTDFTEMCANAKREAFTILNHRSLRENNDYNEVIVYVRSCRYAGKYK